MNGVVYPVLVGLYTVGVPRVKVRSYLAACGAYYVLRQPLVERETEFVRGYPASCIKNCLIAQCMHTRIGAACPDNRDIFG